MISKKIFFVFVLNLAYVSMAHAAVWIWQKDCTPAATTRCEVWFNSLSPVDRITVEKGAEKLNAEYKNYTELESQSINVILLHVSGLDANQSGNLKQGLMKAIEKSQPFQKFGIYNTGNTLTPLAPLGATKDTLKKAVQGLTIEATTDYAIRNLESLISIIDGAQSDKKVIYWVTQDIQLTDAKLSQLAALLKKGKIHIVITHLLKRDISQNNNDNLAKLAKQENGFYQQATLKQWSEKLALLSGYAANGGELTIKSETLCGQVSLNFTANAGQTSFKTKWQGDYPECAAAPAEQTQTQQPAGEQTTTPGGTETASDEPGGQTPGDGTDTNTQSGEPTPTAETATAKKDKTIWIIAGAVAGLVLLVVILVLVLKGGKRTLPAPATKKRVYGVLIETSGSEEKIYSLENDAVKVGRSHECDVVLVNDSVSAIHAELKRGRDGSVTIIDLKSSNGTKVNNEEIVHNTVLKSGDIISFGEARLTFRLN